MNMPEAVRSVLSKYASVSGRAARPEYWWWFLALLIVLTVLQLLDAMVIAPMLGFEQFAPNAGQPLTMVAVLALTLPNIAVAARRLHDIDKSAWWLLLGLIPFVGSLVLLYFLLQPGTEGGNRFG